MQPKNTLLFAILFSFFTLYLPDFTSGLNAQTTTGLYGCKFYDLNCNGIWDSDEPAIGGWPIIIKDASGNVVVTTTTNEEGCWSAQVPSSPAAATYYEVSEGSFPGWTNTFPPNGTYGVQVAPNQPIDGLNFGNCLSASLPILTLTGCKYHDLNCNGIVDPNEPTIPGWTILVEDQTNGLNYAFLTDASGCYEFPVPALAPGGGLITYKVSEFVPFGWTQTGPATGYYTVQQDGGTVAGLDFLNCDSEPPATTTLSGCKFNDLNCNGIWDANEPSLPNWPIYITDITTGMVDTVYTNADGCWSAEVPAPASYEVSEGTLSPYWHQTYPPSGSYLLSVAQNQPIDNLHFGNNESHLYVTFCKFHDLDCDSLYTPGVDTLLPNWPIIKFVSIPPQDTNGVGIAFSTTVYTDESGCYIDDLAPGAIYSFYEPDVPGWAPTLPLNFSWDFRDPCGSVDIHAYFGNMQPQPYEYRLCKVHDINCNGEYEPDIDTLLPDWPILVQTTLYENDVQLSFTDTFYTDSTGCLGLALYPGNSYVITEADVPGWTPSAENVLEFDFSDDPPLCLPAIIDPALYFLNCNQPPPQDSCGAIVEDDLQVDCDEDGFHYTYTFFLQNNSSDNITSFLFNNFPGMPDYFSNNNYPGMFPIPPGGVAGPFSTTITVPFPVLQGDTGCFTVTLITDGDVCCHFEHCVEIPPIDPCDNVHAEVTPIDPPGNNTGAIDDDCCYEVNLINDFCPNFFTGVTLEIQTPGVTFSNYTMGSSLWAVSSPSPTLLVADYLGGINGNGHLPLGPSGPFFFCINTNGTALPVQIKITWTAINPVDGSIISVCEEFIEVVCDPPCATVTGVEDIYFNDGDTYIIPNFCVSNNTSQTPTTVLLEVQSPAGVTIDPDHFDYTGNPSCTFLAIHGVNPGDVVVLKVLLLDEESGWCCHVFIDIPIPGGNLCIDPSIINTAAQCPTDYEPVCGCDGVTYLNECVAQNYYGVTNWTPGPCPDVCIEDGLINTGVACTQQYDPVCGCDGVTYTNACIALFYYGVTQWTPGPCPVIPNPGPPIGNPSGYAENVQYLHGYPNPVSRRLYLDLPSGKYQIETFNTRGQTVAAQTLSVAEGDETPSVETSSLPDGVYLLHATDENGKRYLLRFVKTGN